MASVERFEDLKVWQKARLLAIHVYQASLASKFQKDFVLRDQARRGVVSVLSNIAEGFERNSSKKFMHFLSISKASAGEFRAQLYLLLDLDYIEKRQFGELYGQALKVSRMSSGLMAYLQKAGLRRKFEVLEPEERCYTI